MYLIFDTPIECDIALPELKATEAGKPCFHIQRGIFEQENPNETKWHYDWQNEDGSFNIRFGYLGNRHMLGFPALADFSISLGDRIIRYYLDPDIAPESLRHLLLDQVLPRSFGQLGKLILHASAVKLQNGKGIAFLGESGWGKSTLASSFLASGAQLFSDDCIMVEQRGYHLIATASYHGVRLFDDSANAIFCTPHVTTPVAHYSTKRRRSLSQPVRPESVVLDSIFLLRDPADNKSGTNITIERIRGTGKLLSLIRQLFLLDPLDKKIIAQTFNALGTGLECGIPVYQLGYPLRHKMLAEVHRAIYDLRSNPTET